MADSRILITGIEQKNPFSANVNLATAEMLDVHMGMEVVVPRTIPVCISVCKPICARSDYEIRVVLFDTPLLTVSINGVTRFFDCGDEQGTIEAEPVPG